MKFGKPTPLPKGNFKHGSYRVARGEFILDLALRQGRISPDRHASLSRVPHAAVKRLGYDEIPFCEAQITSVCTNLFQDIHHKAKRGAWLTTYKPFFMAVCRSCHVWIENNVKESVQKGWIIRLSNKEREVIIKELQQASNVGNFETQNVAGHNGND